MDTIDNNLFDLSKVENQRAVMCILAHLAINHPIVIPIKDLQKWFESKDWSVSYDMVQFDSNVLNGTITISVNQKE